MVARSEPDRRKAVVKTLKLGQPLFIQVAKPAAATSLAACALLVFFAETFVPPTINLGGFFLVICASAAWFIGNRFAVLLGTLIVALQFLNGHLIDSRVVHIDDLIDVAFRLGCALAVVLMLGVARIALEIEWRHARHDPLTGALNRKAFFEAVKAKRDNKNLTVLIFADLDGLKSLNDQLGHEQGDAAIRNFSNRVRSSIRKNDIFARLGGDEFVILLDLPDKAAANTIAERLHRNLNLQPEVDSILKCSLGILLLPEGSKSIDRELKQADLLMYQAKRDRAGFSTAILAGDHQDTLIQIASGINSEDLQDALETQSELRSSQRALPPTPDNSVAA